MAASEEHLRVEGRIASIALGHVRPKRVDDALQAFAHWLHEEHGDDDDAIEKAGTAEADAFFADYAATNPMAASDPPVETTARAMKRAGIK